MSTIIKVENLSKRYRIGLKEQQSETLAGALVNWLKAPISNYQHLRRLSQFNGSEPNTEDVIWALNNVSFDVQPGEVVGIIGRNGAGKSTLLKILSEITEPTSGRVILNGRVSSLLEVGTGFHPELTGRENVYLNGTILGMTKAEIDRKFDEIVDFSGVEKFLDTPVKRYSSGMQVRLAFAVAAHLEPEILIVDEVLAVGDMAFQKKCLGKMEAVSQEGRTVLFVSHNLAAVERLCSRGILLQAGQVSCQDRIEAVIQAYTNAVHTLLVEADQRFPMRNDSYGLTVNNFIPSLEKDEEGNLTLQLLLEITSDEPHKNIGVGIAISTLQGVNVAHLSPFITNNFIDRIEQSCAYLLTCHNIQNYLAGGEYIVSFWLKQPRMKRILSCDHAAKIEIPPRDVYGTGLYFEQHKHGIAPIVLKMKSHN